MKIVEVELSIEAKDDTIAAAKAARIKPLTPAGIKFLINHGAACHCKASSEYIKPGSTEAAVSIPVSSKFIT